MGIKGDAWGWRLVGEKDDQSKHKLLITDGPHEDGSVDGFVFFGKEDTGGFAGAEIVFQHIPEGSWSWS